MWGIREGYRRDWTMEFHYEVFEGRDKDVWVKIVLPGGNVNDVGEGGGEMV